MKEIIVYADWMGLAGPVKIGLLRSEKVRSQEIFSFEYDDLWLQSNHVQLLDPDLKWYRGPQYVNDEKVNFGLFTDSSPDRWGRTLIQRREALAARKENRNRIPLDESDFLLGIQDETRMGALRFKLEENGKFLNDHEGLAIPPLTYIRELEHASMQYESDDFFDDEQASHWLNILLAPGSSLGGARPKASVIDLEQNLWIAKFPGRNDQIDCGAWESIVNQMGKELGLSMCQGDARRYSQPHHSFLTKRFDRAGSKSRIHFASAMTLLGYKDGVDHHEGASYLEIVDLIARYGADPTNDIQELWKRIAFSVAVSNTDDHLRNHGFLLTSKGWKLAPAYDVNPNPDGKGLHLNINEEDNALDFSLVKSVSEFFRITTDDSENYLNHLSKVVSSWISKSKKMGLSNKERELVAPAFRS